MKLLSLNPRVWLFQRVGGLLGSVGLMLSAVIITRAEGPAKVRPNVIVILADDLGVGDVSCLNPRSAWKTPGIDRIAREGRRFTDAHSASGVCTPSRYTLLTGR